MRASLIALGAVAPIIIGVSLGYAFTPKHVRPLAAEAPPMPVAVVPELTIPTVTIIAPLDVQPNKPHTQTGTRKEKGSMRHLVCSPPEAMSAAVPHGPKREVYGHVQTCEWM